MGCGVGIALNRRQAEPEAEAWYVTSFYRFVPLADEQASEVQDSLRLWMREHGLLGLVVLAPEGINGTVAGSKTAIAEFKEHVQLLLRLTDLRFKDSISHKRPFHRISVDLRREIVGLKRPDLVPEAPDDHHLSPQEWHEMLSSPTPPLVIDTRNHYETRAGIFQGAIDPGLKNFSDWGGYLDQAQLQPDQPVLIYCTGGIRCEKAILEMRARGLKEVYQLRDGILGYLEQYPDGLFSGECFVFDDRVALDANLMPSEKFGVCPACGLPSDLKGTCAICENEYHVCEGCTDAWGPVCTKRCRDTWRRHKC